VFLTTRVGSEGLNLQFCNRIVNYELPWNPLIIERRIGRVQRIGQEREVHILNLAAEATIEMHVLRLLDRKIRLFELDTGGLDLTLGEFGGAETLEHRLADAWLRASPIRPRGGARSHRRADRGESGGRDAAGTAGLRNRGRG
jgi:superfamily II DNA/RNA helicase